MRVFLTCYDVRKIFLASRVGKKEVFIRNYRTGGKIKVRIGKEEIAVNGIKVSLKDILWLLNSKSVAMVENGKVYELTIHTKDGKFYRIVCNGDLDLFNLEISGFLLYSKNVPIRDLVDRVVDECKWCKSVLVFGSKLGYYSIEISKYSDVLTVEEDKNMIEVMKYNPCSEYFFRETLPYRICSIYELGDLKRYDCILYCPPPYSNTNRYYHSTPVLRRFKKMCKEKLIIDVERPMKGSHKQNITNLRSKLENLGFSVNIDWEYGLLISE